MSGNELPILSGTESVCKVSVKYNFLTHIFEYDGLYISTTIAVESIINRWRFSIVEKENIVMPTLLNERERQDFNYWFNQSWLLRELSFAIQYCFCTLQASPNASILQMLIR